jgi:hypothetical protein
MQVTVIFVAKYVAVVVAMSKANDYFEAIKSNLRYIMFSSSRALFYS